MVAICRKQNADRVGLRRHEYDGERPEALSSRQARKLIGTLKSGIEAEPGDWKQRFFPSYAPDKITASDSIDRRSALMSRLATALAVVVVPFFFAIRGVDRVIAQDYLLLRCAQTDARKKTSVSDQG